MGILLRTDLIDGLAVQNYMQNIPNCMHGVQDYSKIHVQLFIHF